MYRPGDKFVIEITDVLDENMYATDVENFFIIKSKLDKMNRLDGDYVNEYFGELQDEAYKKGKEDGRNETLEWCNQDYADGYKEGFDEAIELVDKILYIKEATGKGMDIGKILDELRKE